VILTFADKYTKHVANGDFYSHFPPEVERKAFQKLDLLKDARTLKSLEIPYGNKLEKLKGKLHNFHSIRINDQRRIIFIWKN